MAPKAKALPEVRQCTDEESADYGRSATAGAGRMKGQWMVADPEHGGHWATDDEVKGWKVLT